MASKRRLRRECEQKHRYPTEALANAAAQRDTKKAGVTHPIGAYLCPFGNHYHIGHTPIERMNANIPGIKYVQ